MNKPNQPKELNQPTTKRRRTSSITSTDTTNLYDSRKKEV